MLNVSSLHFQGKCQYYRHDVLGDNFDYIHDVLGDNFDYMHDILRGRKRLISMDLMLFCAMEQNKNLIKVLLTKS